MTQDIRQVLRAAVDVRPCLEWAVEEVGRRDSYLLEGILKEEAICHRMARYIEDWLLAKDLLSRFDLSVDVEYNKYGMDPKTVPGYTAPVLPKRKKELRTFPDIIVHQRGGEPERVNLLAVEVKKTSNETPANRGYDLWKCESYLSSNLHYLFSCYVCFNVGTAFTETGRTCQNFRFFEAP